jgi:hypothetical protein
VVEPPQARDTGSKPGGSGPDRRRAAVEVAGDRSAPADEPPEWRPRSTPAASPWSGLQGKSWAPPPSIGREVNVGTNPEPPSPATLFVAGGRARRRPMALGWDGVRGVVGGRESRPQGEGGQRSRRAGDCRAGGRR